MTSSLGILTGLECDGAVATKDLLPLMGILENSPVLCAYGLVRCAVGQGGPPANCTPLTALAADTHFTCTSEHHPPPPFSSNPAPLLPCRLSCVEPEMPTRPASSASDNDDDALSLAAAGGFSRVLTLAGPW